jgi:tRNA modification GTPase
MRKIKTNQDTIYALSTCYGKAGVAIIRISGPKSLQALKDFQFKGTVKPKVATLGRLYDKSSSELIDESIIIYFPKDNSYTGEDVIELHIHGSIAIIKTILMKLGSFGYLRLAKGGEFTRVALKNNRISLTKAESLIELINSETDYQRKIAIRQYGGELESIYSGWRKKVIALLSLAEAYIDFPEDTHLDDALSMLNKNIISLYKELQESIQSFAKINMMMTGLNVSIVGATNTGKSTLMNILSETDSSIISDIKGTTRDVIKVKLEMLGIPVIIHDTAGIRETYDKIESIGIKKSKKVIEDSDIIIIISDISDKTDLQTISEIKKLISKESRVLILLNKADKSKACAAQKDLATNVKINFPHDDLLIVSLKSKEDAKKVVNKIKSLITDYLHFSNANLITNIRHQNVLRGCAHFLKRSSKIGILEIKAEELRYAAKELGALLGEINVEEILDEVFSSFCIGK